jgi:hypothetical protein
MPRVISPGSFACRRRSGGREQSLRPRRGSASSGRRTGHFARPGVASPRRARSGDLRTRGIIERDERAGGYYCGKRRAEFFSGKPAIASNGLGNFAQAPLSEAIGCQLAVGIREVKANTRYTVSMSPQEFPPE